MDQRVDIKALSDQLDTVCERARELESEFATELSAVHPEFRDSAKNLVHYVALRQFDISQMQEDLLTLGLSSLGQAERNVMGLIAAVQRTLHNLAGTGDDNAEVAPTSLQLRNPRADIHKRAILGDHPDGRDTNIMVTLPTEAGSNPALVAEMISAGMDVARINCAHDDVAVWERMVSNVRAASAAAGTDSRIMMDLAGPKLRTGELRPGPRVMHLRPKKDALGRVVAPRRIRFMPEDMLQHGTKSAVIPVPRACMEQATPGDEVHLQDTRGKRRHLKVVEKDDKGLVLESYNVVYIATGTELQLVRQQTGETLSYRVGELPAIEQPILLRQGDFLILHAHKEPGEGARTDANGEVIAAAHIACQQPEVFAFVNAGDPISLNDGKISGVVRAASPDELEVEITKAKPSGSRLRGQRGINFPGSDIQLPGLTASDREHLRFVVEHADAVSLSFVRKPDDIRELQDALEEFPDNRLGVVIKIETKRGFSKLPQLILTAMRSYPAAVMIARGDLAVECGWERLAELQEEILWFCEAARLPVMWATQVLEDVAKKGQPSRAEISDAAMSQRADCVMLNKGPYILAAIRMLDNILRRMQKHQFKKTARMKKLSVSSSSA